MTRPEEFAGSKRPNARVAAARLGVGTPGDWGLIDDCDWFATRLLANIVIVNQSPDKFDEIK